MVRGAGGGSEEIESELSRRVLRLFGRLRYILGRLEWDSIDGDGGGEDRAMVRSFFHGAVDGQIPRLLVAKLLQLRLVHFSLSDLQRLARYVGSSLRRERGGGREEERSRSVGPEL